MSSDPLQKLIAALDEAALWDDHLVLERYQLLKRSGECDTRVFYVMEGCLRFYLLESGKEHSIRFGYSGDMATVLDSFISGQSSPLEVQALRRTVVRTLTKKRYLDFMQSSPEYQKLWSHLLEQLVHQQMEREYDLLTSSPSERYRRVLERSPQLFQEVPLKYIASYLRMAPETLSRIQNS